MRAPREAAGDPRARFRRDAMLMPVRIGAGLGFECGSDVNNVGTEPAQHRLQHVILRKA